MRLLLVVNYGKPGAIDAADELVGWLDSEGVEHATIDSENIIADGRFTEEAMRRVHEGYDLILTFGGDGTLLSAAQLVFRKPAPLLGINFGTLGFLTGTTSDSMIEAVQAAMDGKISGESRSALDIVIEDISGRLYRYTVMNEIALTRGTSGKIVGYRILIDGEKLANIRADGIIVSSPTGSTAYSLSAGGPMVSPSVSCMIITALAPHSLISRAMVTGSDETVEVILEGENASDCFVFLDGNRVLPGRHFSKVTVNVHEDAITLLRYNMPRFTSRASLAFYREQQ